MALLPDTESSGAVQIAESLISAVREAAVEHSGSVNGKYLTISLGVCTLIPNQQGLPSNLIECADNALYQAKHGGRDRYEVGGRENS